MKFKSILLPLFFLTTALFLMNSMSCYTTFKHPPVYTEMEDSTGYYHTEEEIALIDDCSSCHEQESPYVEYYDDNYNDPVYDDDYNWNYYFVTPWWFDEGYYYDEPRLKTTQSRIEPTQRRTTDRRDSAPMPRYTSPRTDRPALAKPSSDSGRSSVPAPQPHKRNERRQTVTRDKVKTNKPATPPPKREKRESSEKKTTSKKEKK